MQPGLGLPLVRHIMEEYGGKVTLSSAVGEGSTFSLIFPSSLSAGTGKASSSAVKPVTEVQYRADIPHLGFSHPERVEGELTVLVVEDHQDLARYIESILEPFYQFLSCSAAGEALSLLKTRRVDLLVSDIMMPQMDGHSFLREVQELFSHDPIPLIFLTARDSVDEKIHSLREGAVRYITKPFQGFCLVYIHSRISRITEMSVRLNP